MERHRLRRREAVHQRAPFSCVGSKLESCEAEDSDARPVLQASVRRPAPCSRNTMANGLEIDCSRRSRAGPRCSSPRDSHSLRRSILKSPQQPSVSKSRLPLLRLHVCGTLMPVYLLTRKHPKVIPAGFAARRSSSAMDLYRHLRPDMSKTTAQAFGHRFRRSRVAISSHRRFPSCPQMLQKRKPPLYAGLFAPDATRRVTFVS